MGWFLYMLAAGGLIFLGWFMDPRLKYKSFWSYVWYFGIVLFAVGLLPILFLVL